ncbi:neurogenic protein mastermind-like isoform X3 [Odontomachus brunneus]|uniref:neurogenic protein mastermind-like isoform X3 n=1 Tax=Odontomachus brunneus TaxID=486640 RepID=UPI0013F239D4|nr:neurogenic protein mastermind-like isoform X3 [Odontomachus brunneus]
MEAGGLLPRQSAQGPPGVAPGTINVCAGQGPNGHAGNIPAATIHDLNAAAAAAAAAAAGQLGIAGQQQLHLQQQQHLHQQQQQQMGQAPGMGEVLITPKRQAVVDRLRRRIESYRRRQTDCIPRFDQSFNGLCEQNIQDTLMLKQRFLESKAKRQAKKTDKKQNDPVGLSNVHVQQKFLKRTAEELEPASGGGGDGGFGEPPVKLQCTQAQHQHQQGPGTGGSGGPHHGHSQHQPGGGANSTGPTPGGGGGGANSGNEGLTKFSVEIVQQLEFTASTANSQAQQISTNVTVKALTNASVKSDLLNASSSPKPGPDTPSSAANRTQVGGSGAGAPGPGTGGTAGPPGGGGIGCVDIGNLVECKQEPGLESDFVDLEQCAAALEKDAAANGTTSSFSGFPEFIGDDTGDEIINSDTFKDLISEISDFHPEFMKDFDFEDKTVDTLPNSAVAVATAAAVANNNNGNNGNNVLSINNGQIKMEDDKDAIHQQQQHNSGANNGVNNNASNNNGSSVPANASPGALASSQYSPARLGYSGLDFKSEMSPAAQTLKQMAEQHQHKSQQLGLGGYNHTAAAAAAAARGSTARSPYAEFSQFGGASDYLGSPGSAVPTGGQTQPATGTATYHKNNTTPNFQNQQTNDMFVGSQTQFTAGLADMKRPQPATGGKPGMLGPSGGYKQPYSPYNNSPGPMPNHGSPQYPLPPRGSQTGGPNQTSSQGPFNNSTPPRPPSGPGTSTLQINQAQQLHINNPGHQIQVSAGQHMQLTGDLKPGVSVAAQQGMFFNQQQTPNQPGPGSQSDTYCSVSQSQTINFTQQSLRQRAAAAAASGVPQPGAAAGARGHPQQVPTGQVDQHQHAKILQQQQQLQQIRAQQVMQQQQQQHMAGMGAVRPPPPEYKAAAQAQMMHASIGMGQQARFANTGPMRRVTQQPMPPSDILQSLLQKKRGRKRKVEIPIENPDCLGFNYDQNLSYNPSNCITMPSYVSIYNPPLQHSGLPVLTPGSTVQNLPNSTNTMENTQRKKRIVETTVNPTTIQTNNYPDEMNISIYNNLSHTTQSPYINSPDNSQLDEYQLNAGLPRDIIQHNYICPMMRPQLAQQQQQALHATGGNMYMGGGGMAAIGGMHQMHQRLGYPRTNNQRPPNVSVGPPDGLGNSIASRGGQQEWRHVLMQQQGFQAQMRSQFNQQGHQGGFGMGGAGGMQMTAAQMQHQQQLIRSQNGGIAGSGMSNSTQMQQLLSQQHQQQTLAMQNNNQMSLQMQMSQTSSVNSATGTGSPLHPHQQYGAGSPGVRSLPQQHTQPQATTTDPDFTLEFLDTLPTGDASNFSAQELLNSLDTTASFNLDIL